LQKESKSKGAFFLVFSFELELIIKVYSFIFRVMSEFYHLKKLHYLKNYVFIQIFQLLYI